MKTDIHKILRKTGNMVLVAGLLLFFREASASGASAWVVGINGAPVRVRGAQKETLRRGMIVASQDTIETDARSKIKILLADDSILTVGPRSRFLFSGLVTEKTRREISLRVLAGRFKMSVEKFFGGKSSVEVTTPTAVAGVRGTILWGDTELDAICSLDGTVEVRSLSASPDQAPASLPAGNCVAKMGAGKTEPLSPSAEDLAKYLAEVTLE